MPVTFIGVHFPCVSVLFCFVSHLILLYGLFYQLCMRILMITVIKSLFGREKLQLFVMICNLFIENTIGALSQLPAFYASVLGSNICFVEMKS